MRGFVPYMACCRGYWAQYTEWELWPHLIRFRSRGYDMLGRCSLWSDRSGGFLSQGHQNIEHVVAAVELVLVLLLQVFSLLGGR